MGKAARIKRERKQGNLAVLNGMERREADEWRALEKAGLSLDDCLRQRRDFELHPIHCAVGAKNIPAIRALIAMDADLNAKACDSPALNLAACEGLNEIVKILIGGGADIDIVGGESQSTALMIAAISEHEETVKILIDAGADLTKINAYGKTAADYSDLVEKVRAKRQAEALVAKSGIVLGSGRGGGGAL